MAVVVVSSLAIGVAASGAKTHHKKKSHKPKVTKPKPAKPVAVSSSCTMTLTVAVASGDTDVLPDPQDGNFFGPIKCSGGLGTGVASFPFKVADSGDTVGTLTAFFATGSVAGKVDLTETDSTLPTPYDFGNASFSGTFASTKGTGAFAGIKASSKNIACKTLDSIHYTCSMKVAGTLPPPAA